MQQYIQAIFHLKMKARAQRVQRQPETYGKALSQKQNLKKRKGIQQSHPWNKQMKHLLQTHLMLTGKSIIAFL